MDRPIRLKFDGRIESYDSGSDTWVLDRSRDPRELILLTMPPAVPESLSALKATCANAIVHNLRRCATDTQSAVGSVLEDGWTTVYFTPIYNIGVKANFDAYNEKNLADSMSYMLSREFFLYTDTPADFLALMDTTFWDKVVCHMWCHMSDDCTFTYNNWLSLVQAIRDDATLGDPQEWLRLMCILLGRKGLTNLGFLKINDTDVLDPSTDCEC